MALDVEESPNPHPDRGLFDGYESYRTPTAADYVEILTHGMVVLDTNVLLNLYRYSVQARTDFLAVLRALKGNLWIPAQVIDEFWKNREAVLRDPRGTSEKLKQLDEQRSKAISQITSWAKLASLSGEATTDMLMSLRSGFDSVREAIEEHEDGQNSVFAQDTNSDPVLAELEEILEGCIGNPFSDVEFEAVAAEGERRLREEIPPGYSDVAKKGIDGALGDYFVWEQLLRHASTRACDVLFVTSESKPDWWRMVRGGELRGPRRELVRELRARAGVKLLMLQPDQLLMHATAPLKVTLHEETAQYVARIGSSLAEEEDLPTGGWTGEAIEELLVRLKEEGPVQAAALQYAAEHDGYISREEVYALGDYDPGRQLKGFTRPIRRLAEDLRNRGVIAEEAVDVLDTVYDHTNFGWASGFRLAEELIPLLVPRD